jgi:DNA-binding response OmpR family regulator
VHVLVGMAAADQRGRIAALFADQGHTTFTTDSRASTLEAAATRVLDLLVLDGSDAAFDGHGLLERVRLSKPALPILLLTALGDVDARVLGLSQGADDALEVPFAPSQMMARATALTRRAARARREPEVLKVDGCELDLGAHVAKRGKVSVQLTAREVGVLRWLHANRERAVTRAELLQHVWGLSPNMETRTVDVAISALRKKIEVDAAAPRIVTSVRGTGYRFSSVREG